MKVYGNLKYIYDKPYPHLEFEVLNELKDLSNRSDANCLFHTRFVFECDGIPVEAQRGRADELKQIACRATFSGSKSVHVIFEFTQDLEEICSQHYKEIWAAINELFFNNQADRACANPARLTRRPGATRDNGAEQTLIYENDNKIEQESYIWKMVWRKARSIIAANSVRYAPVDKPKGNASHDGMCENYDSVTYYLRKSFPKLTGNGDSSSSLFKAVYTCMKYNDNTTLEKVLTKARNERWSNVELERIQSSVKNKYLR